MSNFPKQFIPDNEKTDEWCKENIDAIVKQLSHQDAEGSTSDYDKDVRNYRLYNGDLEYDDYSYVTEQYNMPSPATMANYPITRNKIDLLCNEDLSRPLDKSVFAINMDAALRKEQFKVSLIANSLLAEINSEVENEFGMELEMDNKEYPIPDDIDLFMRYQYKEVIEESIHDGLDYLTQKYQLKHLFKEGLRDMLVTAKQFYKVYIKDGDPYVRRVDPRTFVYDKSIESDFLDRAQWCGEERWLNINEVIDEFRDQLDADDIKELEEMRQATNDYLDRWNGIFNWVEIDESKTVKVRVVSAEWKSIKALRFKVSENKYNPERPFRKAVGDNYKKRKGETIETKYVDDIWEGTQIGGKILVNCQRRPNQVRSVDDAGTTDLSYVGVIFNHTTGKPTSLVDILSHIQMLYNIVMYHIELALARSGGKAVVYDVSQMPTEIGMDMQEVMYHLKNDGIIPINSREEGGETASFNQFQQVDFTLSNSVQQLINLKLMLEQTAGQISGVSPQREGAVEQYEYVGNVQRAVTQSSISTGGWFYSHNEVKKKVFDKLANLMKMSWAGGKKAAYVLGDAGYKMLNVLPDVALNDYGIFLGDAGKDDALKQSVQQMSQAALQSGSITLLDALKVLKADTMTEAQHVLEQGIDAMKEQQMQQQEQAMQQQQAAAEAQQAQSQAEMQMKQMEIDGRIKVAQINAEARVVAQEVASDANRDIDDSREKNKLSLEKVKADFNFQQKENDAKNARRTESRKTIEKK
jgi:hypothetical protein|tara:strand:+ start:3053 stop:5308 length:2256 start_codon:yes stop_codon:yes gene_type:complete